MPQKTFSKVPYFELRVGGFRIVADRAPVKLLMLLSSTATGFAAWFWGR
ncbi:hypothetical protein ACFWPU_11895 [Streptomyces sp. NPDC058471]